MLRALCLGLCLALVAACGGPSMEPGDAAGQAVVGDAARDAPGDATTDRGEVGDVTLDGGDAGDGGDGGDAPDAEDSVARWDIHLPDVGDGGAPPEDRPALVDDRPVAQADVIAPTDVFSAPDVASERSDVVAPDVAVVDRPDVVVTTDVAVDRPDVVTAMDVVTLDRPDVVTAMDVVTLDRPDVVTAMDVVTLDRPDVVTAMDVVALDRPDVVTAMDVVTLDRPDVVTATDVVAVDRPDVIAADRPDVVTAVDAGTIDAGGSGGGADPVAYTGTFPARTGVFNATLNIAGDSRSVRLAVPANAGSSPPMIVLFHGTNGDGSVVMTESNAAALATAQGVIVAAPTSRWLPVGDFDHASAETYWETTGNTNPDANQDVLLTRAILVEARRVYGVDPARVYVMGHSNGAFFSVFVATLLRDRIAAFASNSGGLVTCARTTSCGFQGSGTTCATLATRAGWCACAGPELPIPLATTGRRVPGFITHGTADPMVSVYYSCTLQARMTALGMPSQVTLFNGEGHAVPPNWAQMVWPFFQPLRLAP